MCLGRYCVCSTSDTTRPPTNCTLICPLPCSIGRRQNKIVGNQRSRAQDYLKVFVSIHKAQTCPPFICLMFLRPLSTVKMAPVSPSPPQILLGSVSVWMQKSSKSKTLFSSCAEPKNRVSVLSRLSTPNFQRLLMSSSPGLNLGEPSTPFLYCVPTARSASSVHEFCPFIELLFFLWRRSLSSCCIICTQ